MVQWVNVTRTHKNGIYVLKIVIQELKSIPAYPYLDQREDVTVVKLPYFGDEEYEGVIERAIPTITVQTVDGPCESNYRI